MLEHITPVVLTFNEEQNIDPALSCLAWAKDIVVARIECWRPRTSPNVRAVASITMATNDTVQRKKHGHDPKHN